VSQDAEAVVITIAARRRRNFVVIFLFFLGVCDRKEEIEKFFASPDFTSFLPAGDHNLPWINVSEIQ
jgi:hypothetical protein